MTTLKPIKYLFSTTTRAETPNAPPFDPASKVKSWADPGPANPTAKYLVLDPSGKVVDLLLSNAEAMKLNLPGHPNYPLYAPAPTKSAFAGSNIALPYHVTNLSDAQSLVKVFGLTDAAIFDEMGSFPGETISWDSNDPRRCYGIHFGLGNFADVGTLLAQQNAVGVDAPGEWLKDAAGNWSWKSELAPDPVTPDIMPVPLAPLAANEHIENAGFGGMSVIVVDDPTPAPSSGGGVDLSADPTAQAILTGVNKLVGLFKV